MRPPKSRPSSLSLKEPLPPIATPEREQEKEATSSSFRIPTRAILSPADLDLFASSQVYDDFLGFVVALSDSVRGKKLSDAGGLRKSDAVNGLLVTLEALMDLCDEVPAVDNAKSRFGNPAFQTWYDKMEKTVPEKLINNVPGIPPAALAEVSTYLINSFGNRKRIDYGTGHEASFIAFLLCLQKLNVLTPEDHAVLVLSVFWTYMSLMRKLQGIYWLEPAGSHGVWGLDDYHFLPFMFGASQLTDHKNIRPKSIHDADLVEEYSKDYMYLACIQFINSVKSASLRWHSPMLDDISIVKTWSKIHSGMQKMYKAEVLCKLPIMQHFLFGSILAFEGTSDVTIDEMDDCGHIHHNHSKETGGKEDVYAFGQAFPDCCGIRIPSAVAAAAAGGEIRVFRKPIPFD
ncbi:Phosphotyrosyl phosphatase activator [Cladochytrium replicatum]|nr:Phosphotyrosyl phosphatase activator [Cladochytrium replicatum]